MIGYGPPMVGFRDYEAHAEDLAPIAITWKNGEPITTMGILGDPSQWDEMIEAHRLSEEAERADREEAISLANIYLLDNYRR